MLSISGNRRHMKITSNINSAIYYKNKLSSFIFLQTNANFVIVLFFKVNLSIFPKLKKMKNDAFKIVRKLTIYKK
jgi:hypothetical protein